MLNENFTNNLTSVRRLWEESAADPLRLGSHFRDNGDKHLLKWELEIRSEFGKDVSLGLLPEIGMNIKAFYVNSELAERYFQLSLARSIGLNSEPDPLLADAHTSTRLATENAKEFFNLAVTKSALNSLSPPDRGLLSKSMDWCQRWAFQETQSFDEITRGYLLMGVIAALAGHNLERARELIGLKKNMPEKQAKLLRNICKYADIETRDEMSYVRIAHPKAVISFFALFNMFRVPDGQTFYRMWGENWCFHVSTTSYLLTWLYFQSVECIADETVTWPMIAEVMTS
jgi:hypothetical protein